MLRNIGWTCDAAIKLHVTEESSYHISVAQLFMKGEEEYSVLLRYLVSVISLGNMQIHNYKMCTAYKKEKF